MKLYESQYESDNGEIDEDDSSDEEQKASNRQVMSISVELYKMATI